jgi:hypothetical protein
LNLLERDMNLNDIALNYFDAFQSRDINSLKTFFSVNVSLRDWEINANGMQDVLQANLNIFNSTKTISVRPLKVVVGEYIVFAEIDIEIDSSIFLRVVDIIEFDLTGKITSIRAFKG